MNVKKGLIIANVLSLLSLVIGLILTPFYNGIYKVYWISYIFLIPLIISLIFSLYCSLTEKPKINVPKRNSKAAQSTVASGLIALISYFILISVFSFYDILLIPIYGFLALSGIIPIYFYWKILKMDVIEENKEIPEPSSVELEIRMILIGANSISLTSLIIVLILAIISRLYDLYFYSTLILTIGFIAIALYLSFTGKTIPSRYSSARIDAVATTLAMGIGSLFVNLVFAFTFTYITTFLIPIFAFILISGVIPILAYKIVIDIKKQEGLLDDKTKKNIFGIKIDRSVEKKTRKAIMRKNIVVLKTLALVSRKNDSIDLEEFASDFKMNIEEMKELVENLIQNGNIYGVNGIIEGNILKFIK